MVALSGADIEPGQSDTRLLRPGRALRRL
jgi:hypothetical protein